MIPNSRWLQIMIQISSSTWSMLVMCHMQIRLGLVFTSGSQGKIFESIWGDLFSRKFLKVSSKGNLWEPVPSLIYGLTQICQQWISFHSFPGTIFELVTPDSSFFLLWPAFLTYLFYAHWYVYFFFLYFVIVYPWLGEATSLVVASEMTNSRTIGIIAAWEAVLEIELAVACLYTPMHGDQLNQLCTSLLSY